MDSAWGSPEWTAAARVVRRAGFGARGADVDAAVRDGIPTWVERELGTDPASDPGVAATPPPTLPAVDEATIKADPAAVRAQAESLVGWWLRRMAAVQHPLGERLTWGWHQHFATSMAKVKSPHLMLRQNELLRAHARGSFPDLARAILTDPAMLFWLDGQRNTRRAPNENLAREFMELFTLGVDGGYTEADVREGARALTGWTVKPDGSEFVAARHDPSAKTILGRTGAFDAQGFADVVLAQASGPAYVVSRWWHQLAAPTAPTPETLARLLEGYGPAGDATGMIRAILTDPAFAGAAGTMVLSPVEWAIGAIRALGVTLDDQRVPLLLAGLRRLGQVPLLPPDVAGWPAGEAWLSTAAASSRASYAVALAGAGDLSAVTAAAPADRAAVGAALLGIPALTARTRAVLAQVKNEPQRLVAALLISPEYLVH